MGSSINDSTGHHHGHLTLSHSGPGLHTGCSIGRMYPSEVCGTDLTKWATTMATLDFADDLRRAAYAYTSGAGTMTPVDTLMASQSSAPSGSPWTNSAASWWATLTTAEKAAQLSQYLKAWADVRLVS